MDLLLPTLLSLLLGPADVPGGAIGPDEGPPPDIIMVLADDLGWEDVEAAQTPHLDALRGEGVSFESCFAMPNCSPGRYALLFGRWPRRSGMGSTVNSQRPPAADNPAPGRHLLSLPKLLKGRGYRTCLVGKWHLGQAGLGGELADRPEFAAHVHGFDDWLAGTPANIGSGGYADWERVDNGKVSMEEAYTTRVQRDAALRWWKETPGPRFLLVSLQAPHAPHHFPPADMLPEGVKEEVPKQFVNDYLAMVSSVDNVVGALRAASDPERTLFYFLADNGTPRNFVQMQKPQVPARALAALQRRVQGGRGQKVLSPGKGTTFEAGIRVPLVVAGPGVARGGTTPALVSLVDLLATLGEQVGLARPVGAEDSRSFLGELREPGSTPGREWVLAERYDEEVDDVSLRGRRYKLRRFGGPEGIEVLVDLAQDPLEEEPLWTGGKLTDEQRAAVERLRQILDDEVPARASL